MMNITRREFTRRLGGLGAGGLIAFAGCHPRDEEKALSETPPDKQSLAGQTKLRRLGKTGLMLSPLGFGAQRTRDADLIRYALEQGVNHIETSWLYGFGRPGNSCESVGKAIAGKRDSVCLAVAFLAGARAESKMALTHQFEDTLRDLASDHIDLFLWHHPVDDKMTLKVGQSLIASGAGVDQMLKWKAQGKIRWCGLTTHSEQPDWLHFAVESKLYDVAVVAFNYKSPHAVAKAMQEAAAKGIGLLAMKTQSPHYLDGEATIGDAPDHREALHWVLSRNYVTAAVPGMTTRSQVDLNLKTMTSAA
jgi:predicted aldo/keto reductase-like oxidoreductase